jgi:hypothetical protein
MKFDIKKMIEKDPQSEWYMAGTERTGTFITVFKSDLGKVGFRCVDDIVRVRIEPKVGDAQHALEKSFPVSAGWKQPAVFGEFRFSKVFTNADEAIAAVEYAIKALGKAGKKRRGGYNRFWRKAIRQHLPALTVAA